MAESKVKSDKQLAEEKEKLKEEIKALEQELESLQNKEQQVKAALLDKSDKANEVVDNHIKQLHEYNDVKDSGQLLIGKCAELEGSTTKEIYARFGLQVDD
ncbi:uncharacterized protein VTP21DRAFT_3469 [Calcarisporiella thermophila]|uniref:uncharacterized protein n=1 Tax=Calcarisporiella thermophila TaxID=911321 RepID=UPI0037429208